MSTSFFFYDLETSGISAFSSRIMQFAGQRTDLNLNPIGEPYNFPIKLPEDVLPDPGAIMLTGITPQQTLNDGISEAEFFEIFSRQIVKPNTIFVGFNNIRFDDEFMRFGLFRNFFDSYEWQWKDGTSRWDILDLSRITRALRPEGINWPFASDGKPANRLEYLTSVNNLMHDNAHDALSDVMATIAVAKLIKTKQPKLFEYLLNMRTKKAVAEFISKNKTFVYVSGKYSSDNEKLAVAHVVGAHPTKNDAVLVLNLAKDCKDFFGLNPTQLVESWTFDEKNKDQPRLPVKVLRFNRCPAIAPISTLSDADKKRLNISDEIITKNQKELKKHPEFYTNLCQAIEILDETRQTQLLKEEPPLEAKLYDNFINQSDKQLFDKLHSTKPALLSSFEEKFSDERLKKLVPLYKARNFPNDLTAKEKQAWETHKAGVYLKQLPKFMLDLENAFNLPNLTKNQTYALEELKLYVESVIPPELYG